MNFTGNLALDAKEISGKLKRPADDLTQAISWLQKCQDDHTTCRELSKARQANPSRILPRRLLDTLHSNGQGICLTSSFPQETEYATLSHCWGRVPFIQTKKSLINQFEEEIPFLQLSKTFQDAVTICRRLGIRYLWIDSLCIVQDDPKDWEKEAANMASIYTGSHLTISALAAADGQGGCFPRNEYVEVFCASFQGIQTSFCISRTRPIYDTDIRECPLSSRAWVFQERVLSPRSLMFGRGEIYWNCFQALNNDLWLDHQFAGLIDGELRQYITPDHDHTSENPDVRMHIKDPFFLWYDTVKTYTNCSLTVPSDRLPALAGLAAAFCERSGLSYVAGLWEEDLVRGLLWYSDNSEDTILPLVYRAPSWSWACLDGQINFFTSAWIPRDELIILVQSIQVSTPVSSPHDNMLRFSAAKEGTKLLVRGIVKKFKLGNDGLVSNLNLTLAMDAYQSDEKAIEVFCLPLVKRSSGYSQISALILRLTGAENTYRRIGVALFLKAYDDIFGGVEMADIVII
jgi:hypothetical protein